MKRLALKEWIYLPLAIAGAYFLLYWLIEPMQNGDMHDVYVMEEKSAFPVDLLLSSLPLACLFGLISYAIQKPRQLWPKILFLFINGANLVALYSLQPAISLAIDLHIHQNDPPGWTVYPPLSAVPDEMGSGKSYDWIWFIIYPAYLLISVYAVTLFYQKKKFPVHQ